MCGCCFPMGLLLCVCYLSSLEHVLSVCSFLSVSVSCWFVLFVFVCGIIFVAGVCVCVFVCVCWFMCVLLVVFLLLWMCVLFSHVFISLCL